MEGSYSYCFSINVLNVYQINVFQTIRCTMSFLSHRFVIKDTHRVKAPSKKTPALTKSRNIGIWVIGTSNQLFIEGSRTEVKFL